MHIDRLNALADFLETVPENLFNMWSWGTGETSVNFKECGTSACAMGWAASMPEFNAMGLRRTGPTHRDWAMVIGDSKSMDPLKAGQIFFELTADQAEDLFGGDSKKTYQKAAQIRQLIADHPECVAEFNERKAAGLV